MSDILQEAKLLVVLGYDVRNAEGAFRGAAGQDPSLWSYRIKVTDPMSKLYGCRPSLVLVTKRAQTRRDFLPAFEVLEKAVEMMPEGEIRFLP